MLTKVQTTIADPISIGMAAFPAADLGVDETGQAAL
jgi:hypothetical protein